MLKEQACVKVNIPSLDRRKGGPSGYCGEIWKLYRSRVSSSEHTETGSSTETEDTLIIAVEFENSTAPEYRSEHTETKDLLIAVDSLTPQFQDASDIPLSVPTGEP